MPKGHHLGTKLTQGVLSIVDETPVPEDRDHAVILCRVNSFLCENGNPGLTSLSLRNILFDVDRWSAVLKTNRHLSRVREWRSVLDRHYEDIKRRRRSLGKVS